MNRGEEISKRRLCVIPGDGIGKEVTDAAVRVLLAITDEVEIVEARAGWETFCECGNSVPDETFDAIKHCGSALFGAVASPAEKVAGYRSAILRIRQELDLYANLRPVKSTWSAEPLGRNVDLMIVRENTEGLYSGRERFSDGVAVAEKVVSEAASRRIGSKAMQVAEPRSRQVLIAHKANVIPLADGLFRDCVRDEIARFGSPESPIEVAEGLVDIVAHRLVASPEDFDVIVTTNMYGDVLSDLAAFWCGGMGRAPSLNIGDGLAVAEPVHGSAPDIAGQGVADPSATILALSLLARHHWKDQLLADELESVVIAATCGFHGDTFCSERFTSLAIEASTVATSKRR